MSDGRSHHNIIQQIKFKFNNHPEKGFTDREIERINKGDYTVTKINGKYFIDTFVRRNDSQQLLMHAA